MANGRVGNTLGVTAKNVSGAGTSTNVNGSTTAGGEHPITNLDSITSMRARLTAISSTSYSPSRLDAMTVNDMVYAIRLNDNAGTIK